MENYRVVSKLCDELVCRIYACKVTATNPENPDWMRIAAQRDLAFIAENWFSLVARRERKDDELCVCGHSI